jgi:predicted permease
MLSDLRFRLRALFQRNAVERELDEELRFHVARETEKLIDRGMAPSEAARQAAIGFGGVERIKDDTRDSRGVVFWGSLRQDVAYAWRGLRSRPGFTAAVTLALAIGIGANAAMFSIVDRLLFRPPAYLTTPDRVHRIYLSATRPSGRQTSRIMEFARFADLTRWTTSFDRTGLIAYRTMAVGSGEETRDMTVAAMSGTLFDLFSARPVIGRFFSNADDLPPTGTDVAVLSWEFWQSRFAGRTDLLGQTVHIGTRNYTIIGVAPKNFVGITDDRSPAAFLPVTSVAGQRSTTYPQAYGWTWLEMFARRRPDVSLAAANADLTNAFRRSWEAMLVQRPGNAGVDVVRPTAVAGSVHLARGPEASGESKVFTWVMGVAAIVLLIACANVANLLLARAVGRRREIALRLALGVSRTRLIQQLATESILLAIIGGAVGTAIGHWGGVVLRPFVAAEGEARSAIADTRTLLFVLFISMFVAVATGLAPLLHSMRADINDALKAGARGVAPGRSFARAGLLLTQAALSMVLLVGAGLFARSLWNLRGMRMGYDSERIVYAEAVLRGMPLSPSEKDALALRMEAAAATLPGSKGASAVVSVPFWTNEEPSAPRVPGRDSLGRHGRYLLQVGSPSYFAVTGTRLLAGRGFEPTDRAGTTPVAVISQRMADIIWPGENALGKQFVIDQAPPFTVVGIAENMRARLIDETDEIWWYMPYEQHLRRNGEPQLFVRVDGDPSRSVDAIRQRLISVMPAGTYVNVTPLETIVRRQARSWELGAKMFVGFASIALLLAAIGLYSVVAYAVAERMRELGVRIALGASGADVMRLVLAHGARFAFAGVVAGGLVAIWASGRIEPLLFNQTARDPLIMAGAAALLIAVAVLASARPALSASKVNPSQVLKSD